MLFNSVLSSLGFGGHTTSYAVFGLGMLLVAYISAAFLILYFNVLTYSYVGYTGDKFKKFAKEDAVVASPTPPEGGGGGTLAVAEV